jgi:uncharacterized membrane protein
VNLPDNLLGEAWYWAAWVVWIPLFARSILRAPWSRLREPALFNVWLGMVVLLVLVWSLKAGVKPGLALHLIGATVFTLSFGPHLAFVGLCIVLATVMFNTGGDPFAFAVNALMTAGIAVWLSQRMLRFVEHRLPRHFFVYIFVNGFFGAALAVIGVGAAATALLALDGAYAPDYLLAEYLPYFLLLGFSEAWLSGMLMTLFVVYRPGWVATFDDATYLGNK